MAGMSETTQARRADSLLIRNAHLPGRGLFDLHVANGRIAELAPRLEAGAGGRIIEARGNVLLPGLHDHHLHLFATAAARSSVACGPPSVPDEQSLREALEQHCKNTSGWIRGVGFHDSVCPTLDRRWLDRVCADKPIRIQHRSGMLWILNSCALAQLRLAPNETLPDGAERAVNGELTGRFYNLDVWLGAHIPRAWPSLTGLSRELASFGITGVSDAGVRNGRTEWDALGSACARGEFVQRVLMMGSAELAELNSAASIRMQVGPLKLYLRESDLPDFDALLQQIRTAHEQARAVAIHCVTRVELAFALGALRDAGTLPGDRIEHGAIVDEYAIESLAELGVTVVTQPHFIAERGDQYLIDVEANDAPLLYRGAAFLRGGVLLAAGSDAPYGSIDPWVAMRASVQRRTRKGVQMGADECLSPSQALELFTGDPYFPGRGMRQLAAGQSADLCLLDVPWADLCEDFDSRHVALTVCNGSIVHEAV